MILKHSNFYLKRVFYKIDRIANISLCRLKWDTLYMYTYIFTYIDRYRRVVDYVYNAARCYKWYVRIHWQDQENKTDVKTYFVVPVPRYFSTFYGPERSCEAFTFIRFISFPIRKITHTYMCVYNTFIYIYN